MKTLVFAILCGVAMAESPAIKVIYKLVRLNQTDAIFSCNNGQIPNVTPARGRIEYNYIILSCQGERCEHMDKLGNCVDSGQ